MSTAILIALCIWLVANVIDLWIRHQWISSLQKRIEQLEAQQNPKVVMQGVVAEMKKASPKFAAYTGI